MSEASVILSSKKPTFEDAVRSLRPTATFAFMEGYIGHVGIQVDDSRDSMSRIVKHVVPGSSAHKEGVLVEDEILKINGIELKTDRFPVYKYLYGFVHTTIQIDVRRIEVYYDEDWKKFREAFYSFTLVRDTDYMSWMNSDVTPPSWEEIQEEQSRLAALWTRFEYGRKRAAEYPPISDYMDGVVKSDQQQIDEYVARCLAVKAKYPKPPPL